MDKTPSKKSYVIAVCLSAIFGIAGVQHFYMGRYLEGILDFGLFVASTYFFLQGELLIALAIFAIDSLHTFIVTIMLLTGSFKDGEGNLIYYPGQKLTTGDTTI